MSESIDKSRNLLGSAEDLMKDNPYVTYFLHWFTVPVEVFFHRNFGERWFTATNFYVGLIVLGVFSASQEASASFNKFGHPSGENAPSFLERLSSHSMAFVLIAYVLLSVYHFVMIWWRNRTFAPLHSFDTGNSRFEGVGLLILGLVSVASAPIVNKITQMMPEGERQKVRADNSPRDFMDAERFTEVVLEPVLLILLAGFTSGAMSRWFLISALATAIFASLKHTGRLNRLLDIQDNAIDAEQTRLLKDWIQDRKKEKPDAKIDKRKLEVVERIKNITERSEAAAEALTNDYPDVMEIIESMNSSKPPQETSTAASSQEVKKPVSMPLKQSEFSIEEMIAVKEEPPLTSPPPVFPPQQFQPPPKVQEPPKVARSFQQAENQQKTDTGAASSLPNPPWVKWIAKNFKILGIGAVLIVGVWLIVDKVLPMLSGSKDQTEQKAPIPVEPKNSPPAQTKADKPPEAISKPAAVGYGYVRTKSGGGFLHLRDEPSETAKSIDSLPNRAVVKILGYDDHFVEIGGETSQWYRVSFQGQEGWAWGGCIVITQK